MGIIKVFEGTNLEDHIYSESMFYGSAIFFTVKTVTPVFASEVLT